MDKKRDYSRTNLDKSKVPKLDFEDDHPNMIQVSKLEVSAHGLESKDL